MKEKQWLACTDSAAMLEHLKRKKSRRKQYLFACACCRLVWRNIPNDWHLAVELIEKYADGEATKTEVRAARGEWQPTQGFQVAAFACDVTHPVNQVVDSTAYNAEKVHPSIKAKICNLLR